MRMVDGLEAQLAAVELIEHGEVFPGIHQEGRARVASEAGGVLGMFEILDVSNRPHLFRRGIADNEAAAFVRKFAFRLGCDLIKGGAFYGCWGHGYPVVRSNPNEKRAAALLSRASGSRKPLSIIVTFPFHRHPLAHRRGDAVGV